MYGYIYLTTNLINNKKYIGQHRASKFSMKYLGSGIHLTNAIKKYGKENFKLEVLCECFSEQELNEKEKYFIKIYNAVESDDFYNIAKGGLGHTCIPWNKGKKGVQPVTQKQLDALERGRHLPASEKQKKQLSERHKGIQVSEETRRKCSECTLRQVTVGGRKHVHKEKENKSILPEEFESYLNNGWEPGWVKN